MRYLLPLLLCLLLFDAGRGYAQSQTCTGSYGDAIVNVDFGSGPAGSRGAALSGLITNYSYTPGTPNDGFYTITQSTAGMFDWWAATDHTGNTGGYMMVVNASASKGIFYQQQVSTLCPGTTYEFAAYVLNMAKVVKPALPNITFKITDATGKETFINTDDIPYATSATDWKKYGIVFTTPATGGDVTLTMINNGPGGASIPGNDIALDDITFRPCGPVLMPAFLASNNTTYNGCVSNQTQVYPMTVSDAGTSYISPRYQWEVNKNDGAGWVTIPGATTRNYNATVPANTAASTYLYRMASGDGNNINTTTCRVYSAPLTLVINALPAVPPPVTTAVCQGENVSLNGGGGIIPGNTYAWTKTNGAYTSASPNLVITNAQQADAGIYNLTTTNIAGCSSVASITISITPKPTVTVSGDVNICEGSSTPLKATGSAGVTYSWLPATGLTDPVTGQPAANIANPIASPTSPTTYTVTVQSGTCMATASVTVSVIRTPIVDAGADQKMTEGQTITLNGNVTGTSTYFWTPSTYLSDPNSLTPTVTPTEDITYTLHATTGTPCNFNVSAQVFIRVYKKVVIPSAFTPNGDGFNDTWGIVALETYPEAYTQVFNRLGTVVYQTRGYTKPWDGTTNGTPLPEGTYYYKIDLKPGTTLSGWVAILR